MRGGIKKAISLTLSAVMFTAAMPMAVMAVIHCRMKQAMYNHYTFNPGTSSIPACREFYMPAVVEKMEGMLE